MFARDLHAGLAVATVVVVGVTALEAASRAVTARRPGRTAGALVPITLISIGMTAAGGLALLTRGQRPAEPLHFVYAVLAFVLVPLADSLTQHGSGRQRALARLLAALLALGVLVRLFATG